MWPWIESLQEMFTNLQAGVYPELGWWSYVLLALLVATEGPLSTLIGATAAAAGYLDIRWVFAATVVGNIVGDCVWYAVGYHGKTTWIVRHGRWLGLRPHHVARLVREMQAHAAKLIVFAKIAYGLIVPTLVAAGLARVPWRRWFPVVFLVETLWSILLVLVGFHAADFVQTFERGLHAIGIGMLFAAMAFVFLRTVRRRVDRQALLLDPLLQEPSKEIPRIRLGDYELIDPSVVTVTAETNGETGSKPDDELDRESDREPDSEPDGEPNTEREELRCLALPERQHFP